MCGLNTPSGEETVLGFWLLLQVPEVVWPWLPIGMVRYAPESEGRRTLVRVVHEHHTAMSVNLEGLREVPIGRLRQGRKIARDHRRVQAAALQQHRARVLVLELVGVLPHVADEVRDPVGRVPLGREAAHLRQRRDGGAAPGLGEEPPLAVPGAVAPRVDAAVGALGRELPLVGVRQALARPRAECPCLLQGDPDHGLPLCASRRPQGAVIAQSPAHKEVVGVARPIARTEQILGIVGLGHEVNVHEEGANLHELVMEAARHLLPGELDVHATAVIAAEGAGRGALLVARARALLRAAHTPGVSREVAPALDLVPRGSEAVRCSRHQHGARRCVVQARARVRQGHQLLLQRRPGRAVLFERLPRERPHPRQQRPQPEVPRGGQHGPVAVGL
mmetsp:Transcript_95193/g.293562  ORF Transcript_95193/g.293562 Transcript_95193/m.293562 type:complete len:391 (+) Transcript_95193:45-1217(+)